LENNLRIKGSVEKTIKADLEEELGEANGLKHRVRNSLLYDTYPLKNSQSNLIEK
jgi:hypothetical protein